MKYTKTQIITVVIVALLIASISAFALSGAPRTKTDWGTFENPLDKDPKWDKINYPANISRDSSISQEGNWSVRLDSANDTGAEPHLFSNNTGVINNTTAFKVSAWVYIDDYTTSTFEPRVFFAIRDNDDRVTAEWDAEGTWRISGAIDANNNTNQNINKDQWYRWSIILQESGKVIALLEDSNGNDVAQVSATFTGTWVANETFVVMRITDAGTIFVNYDNVTSTGEFGGIESYTLNGTVNDTEGKPINNTKVSITDGLGNTINSTRTDANGSYSLTVVNGTYTVIAEKNNYNTSETVVDLNSDKTQNFILEKEPKTLKLVFHVTDWLNYSDSSEYAVYLENTDSGTSKPVTDNATVTVENTTLFTIDSANNTVIATNDTSVFGVSNITAEYTTDAGTNLSVTKQIAVSPISIEFIFNQSIADKSTQNASGGKGGGDGSVLPPLYAFFAILKNTEIQYILLSIVAGIGITYVSNAYGGISGVIFLLIAGWLMEFVSLGIVLGGLFAGMFIILNSELGLYKTDKF